MRAKLVNESENRTIQEFPVNSVTWEDVKGENSGFSHPNETGFVSMPIEFDVNRNLYNEGDFINYIEEFIDNYGDTGMFVKDSFYDESKNKWKVIDNETWDRLANREEKQKARFMNKDELMRKRNW